MSKKLPCGHGRVRRWWLGATLLAAAIKSLEEAGAIHVEIMSASDWDAIPRPQKSSASLVSVTVMEHNRLPGVPATLLAAFEATDSFMSAVRFWLGRRRQAPVNKVIEIVETELVSLGLAHYRDRGGNELTPIGIVASAIADCDAVAKLESAVIAARLHWEALQADDPEQHAALFRACVAALMACQPQG